MANNHAFLPPGRCLGQTRWGGCAARMAPWRIDCRRGGVGVMRKARGTNHSPRPQNARFATSASAESLVRRGSPRLSYPVRMFYFTPLGRVFLPVNPSCFNHLDPFRWAENNGAKPRCCDPLEGSLADPAGVCARSNGPLANRLSKGAARAVVDVAGLTATAENFKKISRRNRLIWNSPDLTVQTVRVDRP